MSALFDLPAPEVPQVPTPAIKWTERMMLDLLSARYTADSGNGPRYVYAEHVRNQGGFGDYDRDHRERTGRQTTLRTVDALAIDLWPSSGHLIHGFEVKVSRSDWLHELADPTKADAFKRYVHHWWLVVPDAKIVRDDLPAGWGLLVASGTALRVKRRAPKCPNPEPMTLGLTASWLRAAVKTARRTDQLTRPAQGDDRG